jgi:hypothetical protein
MTSNLYERDFYTWTQDQAARLRGMSGRNDLDIAHLADEVADLGRSELNKARQHLLQALVHLIKLAASPDEQPRGHWTAEVRNQLRQAQAAYSPGMRQHIDLDRLWRDALSDARDQLADYGDAGPFAVEPCPFTLPELVDDELTVDEALERIRAQ